MPLLKDGRIVVDRWTAVSDEDRIPSTGAIVVSYGRWCADRPMLLVHDGALGIRLGSDQPPELIADDLHRFDLVALDFPAFTDGRAYSYARLLRERYEFGGEVRAVGNVLRDQLMFMARCGFDAFEIADSDPADRWIAMLEEIDVWYQPTGDGRPAVLARRHSGPFDALVSAAE